MRAGRKPLVRKSLYVIHDAAFGSGEVCSTNAKRMFWNDKTRKAAVSVVRLGTTGGNVLAIAGERPLVVSDLLARFEGWLPAYMAGAD